MICRDCRIAGRNARFYRNCDGTLNKNTLRMVEKEHRLCRGGTWRDCQHEVPPILKNKNKTTS